MQDSRQPRFSRKAGAEVSGDARHPTLHVAEADSGRSHPVVGGKPDTHVGGKAEEANLHEELHPQHNPYFRTPQQVEHLPVLSCHPLVFCPCSDVWEPQDHEQQHQDDNRDSEEDVAPREEFSQPCTQWHSQQWHNGKGKPKVGNGTVALPVREHVARVGDAVGQDRSCKETTEKT